MTSKGRIFALGTFDGVHIGHARLLDFLVRQARRKGLEPAVAMFEYSPRLFLQDAPQVRLLTTIQERQDIITARFGIRRFFVMPMQKWFFGIVAEDFLAHLVFAWNAKQLVCGENFCLGADQACHGGNLDTFGAAIGLRGKSLKLVTRQTPVSSTRIRGLIAEGDLVNARRLLGRDYDVSGKVVKGRGVASRELGFPTANIDVDIRKILPLGVFKAAVEGFTQAAVVNIGVRPTFSGASTGPDAVKVEAHILDYSGNLYDKTLRLKLERKLRPERHFSSKEELRQQITPHIEAC